MILDETNILAMDQGPMLSRKLTPGLGIPYLGV